MHDFDAEREVVVRQLHRRLKVLYEQVYTHRTPIRPIERAVTGKGHGPGEPPQKGWKRFNVGAEWGGYDQTTWFRMRMAIPREWQGERVVALVRTSSGSHTPALDDLSAPGEALAYLDGQPYQGLDLNRDMLLLAEKAKGGEEYELLLEAVPSVRYDAYHLFRYADLAIMHQDVWDCYWDCLVPLEVYEQLDSNTSEARRLLRLIHDALHAVDLQHLGEDAFYRSIKNARRMMAQGLKDFRNHGDMGKLVVTGHAHIDTAWLWPLRETRRKCARTWSTVLRLMEQYPDYCFSSSQPALYEFVRESYPQLWKQLAKRVKEGRWEPCGAGWVEEDNNITGGESLIRQFVYGNRYFRKHFGNQSACAWLPDAFGYAWTLPQILKGCQIESFVTTKLSWSQFTEFPYSMFQWEGRDGTRVFALMPPLNYNGNPTPHDCIEQWRLFKQKERVEELPYSIGWGDGGGGPTREMLERVQRMKDIVGVPRCEMGTTEPSLARMKEQCRVEDLPVYSDELYLELHRGCQTSQARTKRNNRKLEVLLHDAEFFAACAARYGLKYSRDKLWQAWRVLLTNQFHDILPGSSITEVYQQADKDYEAAFAAAEEVRDKAFAALRKQVDTRGEGTPLIVFNTLSWPRDDIAELHIAHAGPFHVLDSVGNVMPSQRINKDTIIFECHDVPPMGYAVYHLCEGEQPLREQAELQVKKSLIENSILRVRLDRDGAFTSVYDKLVGREVLPNEAKANELQLFEDRPQNWDAWDIDFNYADHPLNPWQGKSEVEVVENGPVRALVRVTRYTERSTITQFITMYTMLPRIDVNASVVWHEKETLLKVAFPVNVLAPRATYHIPFGTIERNTHFNDLRDRARFEVPAHYWADLSEGGYGVSLLNDCKYGYDVHGNVLRLSLLRAPVSPDPQADQGQHEMVWSLYPHGGDWRDGTVQQGYELNHPLLVMPAKKHTGAMLKTHSFAAVDVENLIIETVKLAEDSEAIILRIYECYGARGEATLSVDETPRKVIECDMMEENDVEVPREGNTITFAYKPYEIRTFKLQY